MSGTAIVVFGAAVSATGMPLVPLVRRLQIAAQEATRHRDAIVIVSGGRVQGRPPEAPAMRDWLVAAGVAEDQIVLEAQAGSTVENAWRCADIVARRGVRAVVVVTERYHLLRARLLLERAFARRGLRVAVSGCAADDGLSTRERLRIAVIEALKLARDLLAPNDRPRG